MQGLQGCHAAPRVAPSAAASYLSCSIHWHPATFWKVLDMTTLDQTRPSIATGSVTTSLFSNLFAAITTWNDQRVTRKSLSRLTDRELDDIGLVRSDIDRL